jgi:hypothetical protein
MMSDSANRVTTSGSTDAEGYGCLRPPAPWAASRAMDPSSEVIRAHHILGNSKGFERHDQSAVKRRGRHGSARHTTSAPICTCCSSIRTSPGQFHHQAAALRQWPEEEMKLHYYGLIQAGGVSACHSCTANFRSMHGSTQQRWPSCRVAGGFWRNTGGRTLQWASRTGETGSQGWTAEGADTEPCRMNFDIDGIEGRELGLIL